MDPNEAYKNKIGERVMRRVIEAYKNGEIDDDQRMAICAYILDTVDTCKSNIELFDFLSKLAEKWPIFSSILTIEQGEVTEKNQSQAISQVSNLIKENKIEEAIQVAESATQQTGGQN